MPAKLPSFNEVKAISIIDYLDSQGYPPAKIRGHNYWYIAPYREERTPSLKVDVRKNAWYDHGIGEGGSLLELGAKLHQCSTREFYDHLANNLPISKMRTSKLEPREKPGNKLIILASNDLHDKGLKNYLEKRAIAPGLARHYCREVQFQVGKREYKGIGFPNIAGGYEIRNSWFKGSSSPKDVSFIDNNGNSLCILEGFMDFLSLLQLNEKRFTNIIEESDFLVLNSLSLLSRHYDLMRSYYQNILMLDNDPAAKTAKERLIEENINFDNASGLYLPYKDVNDYLQRKKSSVERGLTSKRKKP